MAKSLAVVKAKKENAFSQIQIIYDLTKKLSDKEIQRQFLIRGKSVNKLRQEFVEALDTYHELELEADPDFKPSYAALNSVDELIDYVNANIIMLENKLQSKSKNETPAPTVKIMPKLPKLEISDFDGTPEKWPVFYQLFNKLIHENENISDLEKVTYLVTHLQGPAKAICAGVLPTAENYPTLYESLVKRYDDKRQLASTYLTKILDIKPITNESEKSLNYFLEHFVESVAALKQLSLDNLTDFMFLHIALKKLDAETSRQFEMTFRKEEMPSFEKLVDFLREQAKILGRTKKTSYVQTKPVQVNNFPKSSHSFLVQNSDENDKTKYSSPKTRESNNSCVLCTKASHKLFCCPVFHKKSVNERWLVVKEHNACFNCLSVNNHKLANCESKFSCSTCKGRHHSLLHHIGKYQSKNDNLPQNSTNRDSKLPIAASGTTSNTDTKTKNETIASSSLTISNPSSIVLLSTALVKVFDAKGNTHLLRALIDNGSQSHLISPECCKKLGLKEEKLTSVVKGLGSGILQPKTRTSFTFSSSVDPTQQYIISALVTDFIEDLIPAVPIHPNKLSHLLELPLADPSFCSPGKLDLLLGAALWPHIMKENKVFGPEGTPTALETSLGYIVMGEMHMELSTQDSSSLNNLCVVLEEPKIDHLVQRFWSLEDVPTKRLMNAEEKDCENFFLKTYKREINGKFSVALPFKQSPDLLGSSKDICIAKYLSQEKRLLQKPDVKQIYSSVMQDYLEKNYISWVSDIQNAPSDSHYLPHHGVYKPESSSTPLRIVFNGSSPTSNEKTLNSLLHVGPKLYTEVFDLLLNFRLFEYAVSADVRKMYLQIQVHPEDRKYQRLIWRPSPEENLQVYELNTVVFGLTSSPYLAQRVIKLLADLEASKYSLASSILQRDIYMDDIVSSMSSEESAVDTCNQLKSLLQSGGFTLSKWCSNSVHIMETIPTDLRLKENLDLDKEIATKILGVQWSPTNDVFRFKVGLPDTTCNKRSILSMVARTFDVLGLISPVLITAKLLVQELWSLHKDWDETPPQNIVDRWKRFCEELPSLSTLEFPRHSSIKTTSTSSLIGFADASEKAYGAVIYVRTQSIEGNVQVVLLCSKSRVAPLKLKSIPRLELCAALLLSKLMKHVIDLYKERHVFNQVIAYSDSTVVLHWIRSNPARWKIFVGNRILQIHENIAASHWRHVSGKENPSDCLSRGLNPKSFLTHPSWFQGPYWLKLEEEKWPSTWPESTTFEEGNEELKPMTVATTMLKQDTFVLEPLLERVSSYKKLMKTTVFVMRFIQKKPAKDFPLMSNDWKKAEEIWIKFIQKCYFSELIRNLKDNKHCPTKYNQLDPFLEKGIVRVGGRLNYSDLPYNQKHPILLPKNNRFVDLLIDHYHQENLHTGAHLVMSLLSLKYWILSVRTQVKQRIRLCNVCFRVKPQPIYPKMAPLPQLRVQQAKAFAHCGVDYAGPFTITLARRRGAKTQKAYICLFVCLVVKAIHLELVTELSTPAFISAFKRFLARRGPCSVMMSDCGSNFLGAKNQLNELNKFVISRDFRNNLESELLKRNIDWKFNPPAAPHFGGIWESNVKCVKNHLKRVIGQQILTYEEFNTFLIQIEALLNSRPLCVLTNDPKSPTALTPAHFLTFGPTLDSLPAEDLSNVNINRLNRYQLIDSLLQGFWKRWSVEYLQTLQSRTRWQKPSIPITTGKIVILKKENSAPLEWPLGVIDRIYTGKDGITRVVDVRTQGGTYRRPVTKVCPLPLQ